MITFINSCADSIEKHKGDIDAAVAHLINAMISLMLTLLTGKAASAMSKGMSMCVLVHK